MNYSLLSILLILLLCSITAFQFSNAPLRNSLQAKSHLLMRERKCDITGKRQNSKCMAVSKSKHRTHRVQHVNLQTKKLWWEEGKKWVRLRIAAKTLRTILKNGLDATARKHKINLNKYSISFGNGPTRAPVPDYPSTFNGTIVMRPRYEAYLKNEIQFNPTMVAEELLPGYVPQLEAISTKIVLNKKDPIEEEDSEE